MRKSKCPSQNKRICAPRYVDCVMLCQYICVIFYVMSIYFRSVFVYLFICIKSMPLSYHARSNPIKIYVCITRYIARPYHINIM